MQSSCEVRTYSFCTFLPICLTQHQWGQCLFFMRLELFSYQALTAYVRWNAAGSMFICHGSLHTDCNTGNVDFSIFNWTLHNWFFCCTSPCERPRKTSLMVSTDQIQNLTSRDLVIRVFPRFWQYEAFRILIGYLWYFPLSWLAIVFTLVLVVRPSTARTISVHCWECLWIAATSQTPFWVLNVQNDL